MMRGDLFAWVVLVSPCLLVTSGCEDPNSGELLIESSDGELVFELDGCRSGAPEFFGVDLRGQRQEVLRIVGGDHGPSVSYLGVGNAFHIEPEDCELYQGRIKEVRNRSETDVEVEGHMSLDCVAPTGERLSGEVRFGECICL